jgi:hypothetical protein
MPSLFLDVVMVVTYVPGQPVAPIFKAQAVQEKSKFFSDCLTLGDGTDRLSRNVGN